MTWWARRNMCSFIMLNCYSSVHILEWNFQDGLWYFFSSIIYIFFGNVFNRCLNYNSFHCLFPANPPIHQHVLRPSAVQLCRHASLPAPGHPTANGQRRPVSELVPVLFIFRVPNHPLPGRPPSPEVHPAGHRPPEPQPTAKRISYRSIPSAIGTNYQSCAAYHVLLFRTAPINYRPGRPPTG